MLITTPFSYALFHRDFITFIWKTISILKYLSSEKKMNQSSRLQWIIQRQGIGGKRGLRRGGVTSWLLMSPCLSKAMFPQRNRDYGVIGKHPPKRSSNCCLEYSPSPVIPSSIIFDLLNSSLKRDISGSGWLLTQRNRYL